MTDRYIAICIPGDDDRQEPALWYVIDRQTRRSTPAADYDTAMRAAARANGGAR